MEYAYALITAKGYRNDCLVKIVKDIMAERETSKLSVLTRIYDIGISEVDNILGSNATEEARKNLLIDSVVPIFVKGKNAGILLKKMCVKYNLSEELGNRYLDNIYISNGCEKSIEDFCKFNNIDVEQFKMVEGILFPTTSVEQINCDYDFRKLGNMIGKKR